jgi:hypothetical protein
MVEVRRGLRDVCCDVQPFITSLKGDDALEKGLYRFLTPLVMDPSAGGLDTSQVDVVHIQEDLGLKT